MVQVHNNSQYLSLSANPSSTVIGEAWPLPDQSQDEESGKSQDGVSPNAFLSQQCVNTKIRGFLRIFHHSPCILTKPLEAHLREGGDEGDIRKFSVVNTS